MALTSTITGDFSNAAWTKTNAVANATDPSRVEINMVTQNNGANTAAGYDLTGSTFSWRTWSYGLGSHNIDLRATNAAGSAIRILGNPSTGWTVYNGTTASTVGTFTHGKAIDYPYWRVRCPSGSTVYFEAASDSAFTDIGVTMNWTSSITLTDLYPRFFSNTTTASGTWKVQQVNGTAAANIPFATTLAENPTAVDSAGTWTTASNAYLTDAVYATNTGSVQNTEYPMDLGGFSFAGIPTDATITGVTVSVRVDASNSNRAQLAAQAYVNTTQKTGTLALTTLTTTEVDLTFTPTLTRADLQDALFFIRVVNKRTASQACTTSVDSVTVTVEYSLPNPTTFLEALGYVGGCTHFYPMTANANDAIGTQNGTWTGTASHGSSGAVFDGTNYISLGDHNDFSLAAQTSGFTWIACMTVDNWQGADPEDAGTVEPYIHWIGKGETNAHEWVGRHYTQFQADGTTANLRPKRTSAYHYNSTGAQGAGSYFEDDDPTGQERFIAAPMDKVTTSLPDGTASVAFPGMVSLFKNGALRDIDGFDGGSNNYDIVPSNTTSPVRVGTREGSTASKFKGKVRYLAFFNRKLSEGDVAYLNNFKNLSSGVTSTQNLTPTGIATTEAFGTPVIGISGGATTVSPTGIATAEAFGTPVIGGTITVSPTGIATAEAFGTPVRTSTITVSPTGIATAEALGSPAISGTTTVSPTSVATAEAFGTTSVASGGAPAQNLAPTGIATTEAFGTPAVASTITVSPTGIATAEAFGSPTVSTPGGATLALVQAVATGQATATSVDATLTSVPTDGNLLVAVIRENTAGSTITLPTNGGTWQWVTGSPFLQASARQYGIAYCANISGASATTTFTSDVSISKTSYVWEFSGVDTVSPLDKYNSLVSASNTSAQTGSTGTLTQADEVVIAAMGWAAAVSGVSIDSGFTLENAAGTDLLRGAYLIASATTALNPTFSWTTARIPSGMIASFKAASGGGPQTLSPSGIATAEAFGTPVISGTVDLAPISIAPEEALGSPVITTTVDLAPAAIGTLEAFGSPVFDVPFTLSPTAIGSAEALGSPTIGTGGGGGGNAVVSSVFDHLDTAAATSYTSGSFTPTAGDLMVVYCTGAATIASDPTLTASANSLTFTRYMWISDAGVDRCAIYVSDQLVPSSPSAMTVTWDITGDAATGITISVLGVSGMSKTGATAVKQTAIADSNLTAGNTPTVTFPANCTTTNPVIGFVSNNSAINTLTSPTGYTEIVDISGTAPVMGAHVSKRDTGETAATITWGSTSTRGSVAAIELDSSGAGGATQNLAATAIASIEAFGTLSLEITPPAIDVAPTAITSAEVVGSPVIGLGAVTISPVGVPTAEVVNGPTIAASVTITGTSIASIEAFGTPTLTHNVTVLPTGIATVGVFGTPTLSSVIVTSPVAVTSAEAFGTPVRTSAIGLSPTGIATAQAMGVPTVGLGTVTITPTGIASAQAFGSPALTVPVNLVPTGIVSGQAFGTPVVSIGGVIVAPTGIASAQAFGTPAIGLGAVTITPTGIASAQAFGTPAITTSISLAPTGITSAQAFGTAVITRNVTTTPVGIASAEAFGTPTRTATVTVTPTGVPSAQAFGSPVIGLGTVTLSPAGIPSAQAFGTLLISQASGTVLSPTSIVSAQAFGIPAVDNLFVGWGVPL